MIVQISSVHKLFCTHNMHVKRVCFAILNKLNSTPHSVPTHIHFILVSNTNRLIYLQTKHHSKHTINPISWVIYFFILLYFFFIIILLLYLNVAILFPTSVIFFYYFFSILYGLRAFPRSLCLYFFIIILFSECHLLLC